MNIWFFKKSQFNISKEAEIILIVTQKDVF